MGELAEDNDWAGIVLNGSIRDSAEISGLSIGVKVLVTHPFKSGERDIPVCFAGIIFRPGYYLYADDDGMIVSELSLI